MERRTQLRDDSPAGYPLIQVLITSTLLTLFVLPTLYRWLEQKTVES